MIVMVALPEFFLCARNHSKHFTYVASFNQSQQLTEVDIIFLHFIDEKGRLSYELLDTQPVTVRTEIPTQASGPQSIHNGYVKCHKIKQK